MPLNATNYFVDNAGSDSNNGLTSGTAWKTVEKVNTIKYVAGDTVFFKRGCKWPEAFLEINTYIGQANGWITFKDYGEGAKPEMKVVRICKSFYIHVENMIFNGGGNCISIGHYDPDIGTTGGNIIIKNCEALNALGDGINGHGDIKNVLIEGCITRGAGRGRGFNRSSGDGISFHETCTGIIRNCIIEDNDKGGIINIGDTEFEVYNNILRHNYIGGIVVNASSTKKHNYHHNIIIVEGTDKVGFDLNCSNGITVDFNNNIIYGNNVNVNGIFSKGNSTLNAGNNIITQFSKGIERNSGTINLCNNNVWNNAQNYSGCSADKNSISLNPEYENSSTFNFNLKSTSACIDAGKDLGYTSDLNENTIPFGSAPDIGVYEFGSSGGDRLIAYAGPNKKIVCDPDSVMIGSVFSSDNAKYIWTTEDGHIRNGNDQKIATVDKPGTYILTISKGGLSTISDIVIVTDDCPQNIKGLGNNSARVNIDVFNLLGERVKTLLNDTMPKGVHKVQWGDSSRPSGIYI